jgi:hypothetical protein
MLTLVTAALAEADKHYAIMDNDWYTAGFVPYLVALDGDVEILGLASGGYLHHCTSRLFTKWVIQIPPTAGSRRAHCTQLRP